MSRTSWRPTADISIIEKRSELLWTIRRFFHERGIWEVQTPILSHDTVVDRHIDPVVVPGAALQLAELREVDLYLQTSPEFGMKRMLAAGLDRIYQIVSVFRAGERGAFHNPEFCMLEWYRTGDDLAAGVQLLQELVEATLPARPVEVMTYQDAMRRWVGCDPLSADIGELADAALAAGLGVSADWSEERDDWLHLLFSEVVQPRLGIPQPVIVTHYPASQSALARIEPADERTAQRFELFVDGIELANGYHELIDAAEMRQRNERVQAQRVSDGKALLPTESGLLAAMDYGLPACSGCALGLDRLLMVASGVSSIDAVIPFPIERA